MDNKVENMDNKVNAIKAKFGSNWMNDKMREKRKRNTN